MSKDKQVQSGGKAERKKAKPSASKNNSEHSSSTEVKTGREIWEENIIRDSETAKERGKNGGIKSGEVRRAKRDARETIQYMFSRMVVSEKIKDNLKELGFEQEEFTNMAALQARLFAMAMGGNLEAYKLLMTLGGYEPEENRKERESIAADRRREIEVDAKVAALGQRVADANVSVAFGDEDNNDDVVIYMPQIASEESCQEKTEENTESETDALTGDE